MNQKDTELNQLIEVCQKCDPFFKEGLERAIADQKVVISEEATFYLLSILLLGLRVDPHFNPETAINRYTAAFTGRGPESFRDIGDTSLMMAGIWWESLTRKLIDVNYYITIGRLSYKKESEINRSLSKIFNELSEKFVISANILVEATRFISETSTNDSGILKMYDLWLRTNNPFIERRLRQLGIAPVRIKTTTQ